MDATPRNGPERAPAGSLFSVALGVAACVAYYALRQEQVWNDGTRFIRALEAGRPIYPHVLYLPAAAALKWLVSLAHPISSDDTLKLLSAISGGVGVGIYHGLATRWFRSKVAALAVVGLLAFSPVYWFHSTISEVHSFHAACAAIFLATLARLREGPAHGASALAAAALAAFLAGGSHLSGFSLAAAALVATWGAPGRTRLRLAFAAGFAAAGMLVLAVRHAFPEEFGGYESTLSGLMSGSIEGPSSAGRGHWLGIATTALQELLIIPGAAAVFLPAGLWILWRRERAKATFCLAWIGGYLLLCAPIGDFGYGGYYVATLGIQSICAVEALLGITATARGAAAAALAGVAPWIVAALAAPWRFATYGAAAALSAAGGARARRSEPTWKVLAPPLASVALVAFFLLPTIRWDPLRRHSEAVLRFTPSDSILIFGDRNAGDAGYEFFFAEVARPGHNFFPAALDVGSPADASAARDRWESMIAAALRGGHFVWFVGEPAGAEAGDPQGARAGPLSAPFFEWLRVHHQLSPEAAGPPGLHRVLAK